MNLISKSRYSNQNYYFSFAVPNEPRTTLWKKSGGDSRAQGLTGPHRPVDVSRHSPFGGGWFLCGCCVFAAQNIVNHLRGFIISTTRTHRHIAQQFRRPKRTCESGHLPTGRYNGEYLNYLSPNRRRFNRSLFQRI